MVVFPFISGTLSSINVVLRLDIPIDGQLICIEVEPPKSKSFLVLAWYHPPSDPVGSFNKLEKVLSFLDKEGKEIILLGDTNCDLTPKQAEQPIDNNSKHVLDLYELFSFKQLIVGVIKGARNPPFRAIFS